MKAITCKKTTLPTTPALSFNEWVLYIKKCVDLQKNKKEVTNEISK